ncbi:MAG: AmpG family muropeptide MFS transporter [Proteobacteria bacterium]|nr:AmpG family muropeptide MFS transporter [Pseudomonadota bacterium]
MTSGKDADKRSWRETLGVYCHWPIIQIFLMGIASGFPLLLTASTLAARLKESGVNIETIGIFALVGIPYSIKFIFAPFIDELMLPMAKTHLQHRKSWAVLTQVLLACSLLAMSFWTPDMNILYLGCFALLTSGFSAMQDVVIDTLRVELVPKDSQGAAAASSVAGYRIGMLMAGAGAFVLATYMPWNTVYMIAAGIMASCILVTLSLKKLDGLEEAVETKAYDDTFDLERFGEMKSIKERIHEAVIAPIVDFMHRPAAPLILLFIALFKLGDAMAGTLSMPFYLDLGFTKIQIAAITKVIGVVAVLGGTFVGGFMVKRYSMMRALWICGVLQILSNFVFVWLAQIGADVSALTACIVVENVTGGMGTAAFVAYMAQLCNFRFTATQYALLTSLSSIGRSVIASSAGFIAAGVGWAGFFVVSAAFGVPGMIILYVLDRKSRTLGDGSDRQAESGGAQAG